MVNPKCSASEWCAALATPNTTVCVLHLKFPPLTDWENQNTWMKRVRAGLKKQEDDAKKAAASDKKLAKRGAR